MNGAYPPEKQKRAPRVIWVNETREEKLADQHYPTQGKAEWSGNPDTKKQVKFIEVIEDD